MTDPRPPAWDELQSRLADAEETLRAISAGEVDAVVVADADGERVFTLATAEFPYRLFVEHMRDGAATLSADGLIVYANQRTADLLGRSRSSLMTTRFETLLTDGSVLGRLLGPDGLGATFEVDLLDGDGGVVPVLLSASPLGTDGERLTCLTLTDLTAKRTQDREILRLNRVQAEQLTQLRAAQDALSRQATHDFLTGLPNRALLVDRTEQALARSRRTGAFVAVFFLDLDRFKLVNDTHGHAAGDRLLQVVAERLQAVMRPMDTVARIGGDEFVVLAPDVDSFMHAIDIGDRLVAQIGGRPGTAAMQGVSASVGIAVSVDGQGTAEALLHGADTAMYAAKATGGGRAEIYDAALGQLVYERTLTVGMLREALDGHRLVAHYQPIVDLRSRRVHGLEALARISRDEPAALMLPSTFISVAESTGLIVALGSQMLERACADALAWSASAGTPAPYVTVNLSPMQLLHDDLAVKVQHALDQSGLPPERLQLEITETALLDCRRETIEQLERIRQLGVDLGLDDFGTGYASLSHIRRLPLAFVKIDHSFVSGLGTDRDDEHIVESIIGLAAHFGLRSIAEGVESEDQLRRLVEFGCDEAQGHLLARPLSATEVPGALARTW